MSDRKQVQESVASRLSLRHAAGMRLLVTFFLIALVAAQFEYVTDAAAFLGGGHASGEMAMHLDPADSHPDHDQNHDDCDHCCHGASHLTAMAVYPPIPALCAPAAGSNVAPVSLASLALTPPVPPPIS